MEVVEVGVKAVGPETARLVPPVTAPSAWSIPGGRAG